MSTRDAPRGGRRAAAGGKLRQGSGSPRHGPSPLSGRLTQPLKQWLRKPLDDVSHSPGHDVELKTPDTILCVDGDVHKVTTKAAGDDGLPSVPRPFAVCSPHVLREHGHFYDEKLDRK